MSELEILPGVGVGRLTLGMTRDEVRKALGDPEEEEKEKHDGDTRVSWSWDDGDLEADFDSDDDYLLGSITVCDPEATLLGACLIGLDEKEFLAATKKIGVKAELDDDFDDVNARDYEWAAENVAFWIQDGVLDSITVMPHYDKTGEIPKWPKKKK